MNEFKKIYHLQVAGHHSPNPICKDQVNCSGGVQQDRKSNSKEFSR